MTEGNDSMAPAAGDMVRFPGIDGFVEVRMAEVISTGWRLMYSVDGSIKEATVKPSDVEVLAPDGGAPSERLLAGFWAEWMAAASTSAKSAALASSTLKPYPHQHYAVYGTMLAQPTLRFLLGDEPGTGKTIMGGLFAREAERLGFVSRCLIVCPAHLVTKWQADFDRFLGGGLRRIGNTTVKDGNLENGLIAGQGFWVVSMELAAMNGAVQEAIHPERAGWDLVIVDEAHRMTPTAETLFAVGKILKDAPHFLAMTATPHRGNEFFFRALMHLVDPLVFPMPAKSDEHAPALGPGEMHLLRRMKEELTSYDGQELLFKARTAENIKVPLSDVTEAIVYNEALNLVDSFFPDNARTLGRMVYGKRAASCLYALRETLQRRHDLMGTQPAASARRDPNFGDPDGSDETAAEHAEAIYEKSKDERAEKARIKELLADIDAHLVNPDPAAKSSKWGKVIDLCLSANGIKPGNNEQAVIFTEYADTADWLTQQFLYCGYTAQRYSGRDDHATRDQVRDDFMAGKFQIIVSTDAGNEGIDLQSAHVLVNWDIPWSLVTLEQRMGRIHRVGQERDVMLYNIIATGTLEGDTYAKLLDRLVMAANEMGGKMFDSLSLVGQQVLASVFAANKDAAPDAMKVPLGGIFESPDRATAISSAIDKITADQIRIEAQKALAANGHLHTKFSQEALAQAVDDIHDGELERINPHIVDRFLTRLQDAGLVTVKTSMLGGAESGLFNLEGASPFTLPPSLRTSTPQLVSTTGDAKADVIASGASGASKAIDLGPATAPFRDLVKETLSELRPTLFQGGVLQDKTTVTDYTLFLYETPVTTGTTTLTWRHLVRCDSDHGARPVPFDMLMNLVATDAAPKPPHPAAKLNAAATVATTVHSQAEAKTKTLHAWQARAKTQLGRLVTKMTSDLPPAERAVARARIEAATQQRLARLNDSSNVQTAEPRLVGWARVVGAPDGADLDEGDSELIAVKHVVDVLRSKGWHVDDVSQEKVGYDLKARRGHLFRAVEVKGVWESASSTGIRLTGGEITRAGLLGNDYWLYIVDQCHDGKGTLYMSVPDPASVFHGLTQDLPILKIKGSDLKANKTTDNAA